jgi:hypothetical protein
VPLPLLGTQILPVIIIQFASRILLKKAKQDILIHCLSLDRARPRDKQWSQRHPLPTPFLGPGGDAGGGPGAVPDGERASARGSGWSW